MKCTQCGLIQGNPRESMLNIVDYEKSDDRENKLKKLFDLMEGDTGQDLANIMEKEIITKKKHFKTKIDEIKKYKNCGKLLDVGCAQGAFLAACSDTSFQLFGVEPSKFTYVEAIKIASNSTIYNKTLLEADFPENNFDVVSLINTLEHLVNPRDTIVEIFRILKPGGLLFIETPNIDHWIPRLLGRNWVQLSVPDHVAFFSKKILTDMMGEIGFNLKEIKSSYKSLSIRLFVFHLSRYFLPLGRVLGRVAEKTGLADKNIHVPQWDEMVMFAAKPM